MQQNSPSVIITSRKTQEFLRPRTVYDVRLPDGREFGGARSMTEARDIARRYAPGVPYVREG